METTTKPLHLGRKISRLRELRGMKQEAMADALGVSQQTVSRLEASEQVEEDMLEKVGRVLGVSIDTIKNFNEEAVINYFNSFYDQSLSHSNGAFGANHCTFNPLDKVVELYERLVQAEKDRADALERLLREK